jgi:acetyl esterase
LKSVNPIKKVDMFTNIYLALALLGLTVFIQAAPTPDDPTEGVPVSERITAAPGKKFVYKTVNNVEQAMEIYFPKDWQPSQKRVAMLLFHGGSWKSGNLSQFRYDGEYFAKRGIVVATANYRMHTAAEEKALPPGESRKRICITDARSAIRWMKQHAGELGIDPDKMVTGGGSAGGHLAVMASLIDGLDDPNDSKDFNTKVVAHLLFNPAFMGAGKDRDDRVDVFAHLKKGMTPAIYFFGEQDNWKKASDVLVPKIVANGDEATLWMATGVGHSFFMKKPWKDVCLIKADEFLVAQGLLKGSSPLAADPKATLVKQ